MQLEGQARASTRAIAARAARPRPARPLGRRRHLGHAPHRRPHRRRPRPGPPGHLLERPHARPRTTPAAWSALGGQDKVKRADRRAVGHPLHAQPPRQGRGVPADERLAAHLAASCRTARSAAGYLTGNFDVVSVSAAASTGIMDLRTSAVVPRDARRPREAGVPRAGLEAAAADRRRRRAGRRRCRASLCRRGRARPRQRAADLPDLRRPAGGPGRRRRGRCRAGGGHPRQLGRRQLARRPTRPRRARSTRCG